MSKLFGWIGLAVLVVAVPFAMWTKGQRDDNEVACLVDAIGGARSDCDQASWLPVIAVAVLGFALLIASSQMGGKSPDAESVEQVANRNG